MDPSGIYLFPKEFNPTGKIWYEAKHRFIVKIKTGMKILDFSDLQGTDELDFMLESLDSVAGKIGDETYVNNFRKHLDNYEYDGIVRRWWDYMKSSFMGRPGQFNSFLRKILNIDAIFDDTYTIHPSETQLIVLDSRNVKVIERIDRKGSGFEQVVFVKDWLVENLEEIVPNLEYDYIISFEKIKKKKHWGGKSYISGYVTLTIKNSDYYVKFEINTDEFTQQTPPNVVWVGTAHCRPDINRSGWSGWSENYEIGRSSFRDGGSIPELERFFNRFEEEVKNRGGSVNETAKYGPSYALYRINRSKGSFNSEIGWKLVSADNPNKVLGSFSSRKEANDWAFKKGIRIVETTD